MCAPDHLESLRIKVKRFERDMPEISKEIMNIWEESNIPVQGDPRLPHGENEENNLTSIHFDISRATCPQRKKYSIYLTEDLALRDLSFEGTTSETVPTTCIGVDISRRL